MPCNRADGVQVYTFPRNRWKRSRGDPERFGTPHKAMGHPMEQLITVDTTGFSGEGDQARYFD